MTKTDYKHEELGYAGCKNCIGERVAYTIKTKKEGGRFEFVTANSGICEKCYDNLPEWKIILPALC